MTAKATRRDWADEDAEEPTQMTVVEGASVLPGPRDRCTLVLVEGPTPGRPLPIPGRTTLGRGHRADLRIDAPGVSRVHATIERSDGRFVVRDLGSTNGTWVGTSRVERPRLLEDGVHLRLGTEVVLRVALQSATEQRAAVQLYESSVRDGLTGLYNRRYFDERLGEELSFARRHLSLVSLLILDIDHFKRVNDTHGHPTGDRVLRALAAHLTEATRTEDVVARYGGEEFAVIARGLSAAKAGAFAERLRSATERLTLVLDGAPSLGVTVSVGVATHGEGARYHEPEAFVGAADCALYEAKAGGRNRCVSR